MNHSSIDDTVVVGVDGSEPARRALEWAMEYAERIGAPVLAVQAWQVPFTSGAEGMVLSAAEYAAAARQDLEKAVDEVARERPGVYITMLAVEGNSGRTLVERSEHAALLVVGNRGHGALVGAIIGSVGKYCVTHARCPVVVVRGGE
ncbi:universal stress protein [Glycomyces mayteni]|uniref:Universal stress protein n=1 Tax=Glycomyces mayteni TaxID=543887 RepID=A0ABW2D628_9ACTN|nr:universal stress protein [Glycomyces mayteni]